MTRYSRIKAAASKSAEQPPLHRGHQPVRCEASDQANPSIGARTSSPLLDVPSNQTAEAGAPSLRTFYGPPTTHRMDGAGGPHNEWDAKIAAAHRRGNPLLAQRLQVARARINLAFELLEPVWVPTPHQGLMLALRADAEATGIATVAA